MSQVTGILGPGFVALTDHMGTDRTPAQCARTSFNNASQERTEEQDARLTRYLVKHKHTTPLEFCQVRFYIKCPMFVGEQILRHRTASINKISYRYVKAAREFYVPPLERMQKASEDKKQGSSAELVENTTDCAYYIARAGNKAFDAYEKLLLQGLAPEIARTVLPLGTFTEFYWQNDLHNTLHFLGLRLEEHAQWETQQYAKAMLSLIEPIYPTIVAAWRGEKDAVS